MATTAASLSYQLKLKAEISFYTQQLTYWTNRYNANVPVLARHVQYEDNYMKAYDEAMNAEKDCKIDGEIVVHKDEPPASESIAIRYAEYKVPEYDEEMLYDLTEKDSIYEMYTSLMETTLENLKSQEKNVASLVQSNAQVTGLENLGGGS